ncbi:hypothetical protein Thiosp_00541 [Thiorhodovibrio litoralis]|nr:hypothetical protein [Thiorhodovibrio winogradskyi]WPL10823.1 hypothetical protein Thiosp_00541 [Thiorhodovibrio litoralis]
MEGGTLLTVGFDIDQYRTEQQRLQPISVFSNDRGQQLSGAWTLIAFSKACFGVIMPEKAPRLQLDCGGALREQNWHVSVGAGQALDFL